MDGRKRAFRFVELEGGCWVCVSHKANPDGYLRLMARGGQPAAMFHRLICEATTRPLEPGEEVHHTCKTRGCCAQGHLEPIDGKAHAVLSNRERYAGRMAQAREYWQETHCTGVHLASLFGVTPSAACRWRRAWEKELEECH